MARGGDQLTTGLSAHTVRLRLRLRLSAVSPRLLQGYRDEALTLDQVMAFAVTGDRAEQERVHGQLQDWQRNPDTIRRLLTHSLVLRPRQHEQAVERAVEAGQRE